jgi:hypothetical protein
MIPKRMTRFPKIAALILEFIGTNVKKTKRKRMKRG